jgi:hypothetical protein
MGRPIRPIASPNTYRLDFVQPENFTSQALAWTQGDCEWSMRIPALRDAFAAVVFSEGHNLSLGREDRFVTFKLKPRHMADHLAVALIDEIQTRHGMVLHEHGIQLAGSIKPYRVGVKGNWAFYAIPLSHFESENDPVDWTNIRGFKMVRHTDAGPSPEIVVSELVFREGEWTKVQRYASVN